MPRFRQARPGVDPLEEMRLRMEINNDVTQEIAKSLLGVAEIVRNGCQCEPMSFEKIASLFEVLAYELDAKRTVWGFNIEEQAKEMGMADPAFLRIMKETADKVNKGRQRIMPAKATNWRKTLGFDPDETPTEQALKQAFRCKARETHPDLNEGADDAAFTEVNQAYEDAKVEILGRAGPAQTTPDQEHGEYTVKDTGHTAKGPVCPNCRKLRP